MGKCYSCGAEDVSLQNGTFGNVNMDLCDECYARAKIKADRPLPYWCRKRKLGLR